ncbi:Ser/Thr protein phosphatase, putative [Trichomonas vaginalis G3]|uniref:Ser/Thr protein phosphatase, putative n=1 Tax=Trichomonas vaginalis (strain ATCC PRA-98 / G3) TaxID=412133 RepID=A2E5L1_TRIV3|nr:phosphoprotein phosphatase protein [Trichomonas vaginalis G3]EAY12052.1 Ser/Thr protein phosphatase, putative [Trichomonas vaginalis G3]KAI5553264.1 phosphoprotein phosphatase protein [Trichomonas vaginalis G3]|eukprot:XP_001324275.1 Ser/Thr protein phosphatase [Trichomonas vaginalis G3]
MTLILEAFRNYLVDKSLIFSAIGTELQPIPYFNEVDLAKLLYNAKTILAKESSLLKLDGRYCVVGDLHGNLHDLLQIIANQGLPPITQYLFLGDYSGAGSNSVEVVALVMALKVSFPRDVFLLKGHQELSNINVNTKFHQEVTIEYSEGLWNLFNEVFEVLPLAAIISNNTFCVHGGIGPDITNLDLISSLKRPNNNSEIASTLIWSEPTEMSKDFLPNQGLKGYLYGVDAIQHFLKQNHLQRMIRSHGFVEKGINRFHGANLYTIFSASCYSKTNNESGCLLLHDGIIEGFTYEPIKKASRNEENYTNVEKTFFRRVVDSDKNVKCRIRISNSLSNHSFVSSSSNLPPLRRTTSMSD